MKRESNAWMKRCAGGEEAGLLEGKRRVIRATNNKVIKNFENGKRRNVEREKGFET